MQTGTSPLLIAASSGFVLVVELLLGGRADVNLKNKASRAVGELVLFVGVGWGGYVESRGDSRKCNLWT